MRRWLNLLMALTLLCALSLTSGCGHDSAPQGPESPGVSLVIRVAVNNPGASRSTRADNEEPEGYPYGFEAPATIYENIRTLRIIIVRPDNSVEHNRVEYFSPHPPAAGEEYGDFTFKVRLGDNDDAESEKKRIYLIANEASIFPAIDFTNGNFAVGASLSPSEMAGITTFSEWLPGNIEDESDFAAPYIDNENAEEWNKLYIPMTEFFDVTVSRNGNAPNAVTVQRETLFITRNLVKFAFEFSKESSVPVESIRVKSISFSRLMQKEFLMPRNLFYRPAKYGADNSVTASTERVVTGFETPGYDGNLLRPYRFCPAKFGISGSGKEEPEYEATYTPELYFCETKLTNDNSADIYTVSLELECNDKENTLIKYEGITLPNLPSLPRNTVVKLSFTLKPASIRCNVDVLPYTGVFLNPIFGIDR